MAKENRVIGNIEKAQPSTPARWMSPFGEIDRLFEEFFPRGLMRAGSMMPETQAFEGRVPRVDVIDREREFVLRAELPGVKKEDVELSVGENAITIKATSAREEEEEKGDYYRCEISRGSFMRTVPLPAYVDSEKAKAKFDNGILELTLPKLEQSQRRRITVE